MKASKSDITIRLAWPHRAALASCSRVGSVLARLAWADRKTRWGRGTRNPPHMSMVLLNLLLPQHVSSFVNLYQTVLNRTLKHIFAIARSPKSTTYQRSEPYLVSIQPTVAGRLLEEKLRGDTTPTEQPTRVITRDIRLPDVGNVHYLNQTLFKRLDLSVHRWASRAEQRGFPARRLVTVRQGSPAADVTRDRLTDPHSPQLTPPGREPAFKGWEPHITGQMLLATQRAAPDSPAAPTLLRRQMLRLATNRVTRNQSVSVLHQTAAVLRPPTVSRLVTHVVADSRYATDDRPRPSPFVEQPVVERVAKHGQRVEQPLAPVATTVTRPPAAPKANPPAGDPHMSSHVEHVPATAAAMTGAKANLPFSLQELTTHVLRQIDRRIISTRERLGRV